MYFLVRMVISFSPAISALLYRSQFLVQKMDLEGNSGLTGRGGGGGLHPIGVSFFTLAVCKQVAEF